MIERALKAYMKTKVEILRNRMQTNFTHNLDNNINVKLYMKFMKEKQPTRTSKEGLFLVQWPESTPEHFSLVP